MADNIDTQVPDDTPPPPLVTATGLRVPRSTPMGPVTKLVMFSIRNGVEAQATSLLVKPTVEKSFHWVNIDKLDPMVAVQNMSTYVQMYHVHLTNNPIAGLTAEQRRKVTIILGVARAVVTSLYEIIEKDLIPSESEEAWLEYNEISPGVGAIGLKDKTTAATLDLMEAWPPLTELELSVVAVLHMSAIGILPLQGYSLAMCNHHYLSDPTSQSRRAYAVVEKSLWHSTSIAAWFAQDVDKIRDVLWHKIGHPVNLTLKRKLAFDPKVPRMLVEAGAAPAASRLPAVESEMRAGNSYKTLFQTVRPLIEGFGGSLEYGVLELAMKVVMEFPAEDPMKDDKPSVYEGVPPDVNCRSRALKWLGEIIEKNKDTAAVAYGFYVALAEQNAMLSGGTSVDTLRTSFSLTKLRSQSLAAFIAGQQAHGDYVAFMASERSGGRFSAPILRFIK